MPLPRDTTIPSPGSNDAGEVLILQGVQGSGKSTFARTLGAPVVSADDFFMRDGAYQFDPARIGEAHQNCFRRFISLVTAAQDRPPRIIVDNTNLTRWEMQPYVLGALAFGYEVRVHVFLADPAIAWARNAHGVPVTIVHAGARTIEAPHPWLLVVAHDDGTTLHEVETLEASRASGAAIYQVQTADRTPRRVRFDLGTRRLHDDTEPGAIASDSDDAFLKRFLAYRHG